MTQELRPRLIISAPFGNYVAPRNAVATLGTFTAAERKGRLIRIAKTVRYSFFTRSWVNKIGLRNPGIDWLVAKVTGGKKSVRHSLVSIHGFEPDDWWKLIDRIEALRPMGVELNMSCPNVGEINWPEGLFERAVATGVPVVAKLPPVHFESMFEQAWAAGIRTFHTCNTLPVPMGGMSGAPLKPVALQCIRRIHETLSDDERGQLRLIGGGGVRSAADVDDYVAAGVNAIAVGTKVMQPTYLFTHRGLNRIRARAEEGLKDRADWLA